MSLQLIEAAVASELRDDLHLTRLLLLLRSADRKKRSEVGRTRAVEGITKLAKLDFFLRYPTYLERALVALGDDAQQIGVEERERLSIEAKMVRFRYGPWDARYRRWLGLLVARGLARVGVDGNTVVIGMTSAGRQLGDTLAGDTAFRTIAVRADAVISSCGHMSSTRIKDFVYDTFPEIVDLKWGDEIAP